MINKFKDTFIYLEDYINDNIFIKYWHNGEIYITASPLKNICDFQYITITDDVIIPFISFNTVIISIVDAEDNVLYENNNIDDNFNGFNNEFELIEAASNMLANEGLNYIDINFIPEWINFVKQFSISNTKIVYATLYTIKHIIDEYTPTQILELVNSKYQLTKLEQEIVDSYVIKFINNEEYNNYISSTYQNNTSKVLTLDLSNPEHIGAYKVNRFKK